MANTEQAEVMPVGITYTEPERGSFVKNCYNLPPNTWQVREGFGRVYAHNTSYNLISDSDGITPVNVGYVKQLGSCSFTTSYGHKQILSLFIASVSSLNRDGSDDLTNSTNVYVANKQDVVADHSFQYVVSIYDITTNRHYEQIIGGKTSEVEDIIPMEQQYGFYDRDLVKQTHTKVFPINPEVDDPFYYAELNSPTIGDVIYFGTTQLGLYAYRPIIFDAPPDTQVETTFLGAFTYTLGGMTGRNGWSETGFIEKCSAGQGLLAGGFTYLNQSEFPTPVDITAINNRIAMAQGRNVYFSDTFNGSAIIADNILAIPSDKPITALSEINGVLLIFTSSETFMYQPSVGTEIQTSGRTIKLNSNFGCFNSQATLKVENKLYFADETGIYVSTGTEIADIADPIRPLFRRFIEDPLSYYNRTNDFGYSNLTLPQPEIFYDWKRLKGIHFAKNPLNSLVFLVLPEQKLAWAIDKDQMFSIWSWETINTIENQETEEYDFQQVSLLEDDFRLVDNGDDLFIVNLERQPVAKGCFPVRELGVEFRMNNIYKWKVARGVDFSISYHEDKKVYPNSMRVLVNPPAAKRFQFVIGKPVAIYDGFTTDFGNVYGPEEAILPNTPFYLVPFGISAIDFEAIQEFNFEITFDDTCWEVLTRPNAPEAAYVDVIFPPNRLSTTPQNFGFGGPLAGTNTIRLQAPGILQIDYDGSVSPTYFGNFLNVLHQVQLLFWVPFRQKSVPADENSTLGIGWGCPLSLVNGVANQCVVAATEFGSAERDYSQQEVEEIGFRNGSQPIEWVLQTQGQQGEKGEIIKARGGYLQVYSNGPFPNRTNLDVPPYFNYVSDRGLINVMVSSDYNNYQGQIVDWTYDPPSIRDGFIADTDNAGLPRQNIGLVDVLDISQGEFSTTAGGNQPKVFNNGFATYANLNPPAGRNVEGTILIDGEDTYNTSFSTSTKGTTFFITLYGYCQSFATKLFINKFNSAFRVMSDARRRWKHDRGAQ